MQLALDTPAGHNEEAPRLTLAPAHPPWSVCRTAKEKDEGEDDEEYL